MRLTTVLSPARKVHLPPYADIYRWFRKLSLHADRMSHVKPSGKDNLTSRLRPNITKQRRWSILFRMVLWSYICFSVCYFAASMAAQTSGGRSRHAIAKGEYWPGEVSWKRTEASATTAYDEVPAADKAGGLLESSSTIEEDETVQLAEVEGLLAESTQRSAEVRRRSTGKPEGSSV